MSTSKCESLAQFRALSHWQDKIGEPSGMTSDKWVALLDSLSASTIKLIDRAYMGALYNLEVQPPCNIGSSKGAVRIGLKRAIADLVNAGERDEMRLRERAMCQAVASRYE